jgi:hypothetical protein
MPDYGDHIVVGNRKPIVALPLAELLLPDDKLPPARHYEVRSEWFGGQYPSLSAIIKKRSAIEGRMNNEMLDWQRAILAPCYVQYGVRGPDDSRLLVFGEIPDLQSVLEEEAWYRIGGERDKFGRRLRRRMEDAGRRGWLYGRWHSIMKPMGEFGCQHRDVMQEVLDEPMWLEIKANGWRRAE